MNKRLIGQKWEKFAAKLLVDKGYKILYLNWTSRWAEIDIVAKKEDLFVFTEVKYKDSKFGHPASAVNYHKRKAQKRAIQQFLKKHKMNEYKTNLRFDVIAISGFKNQNSQSPKFRIQHFENVPLS